MRREIETSPGSAAGRARHLLPTPSGAFARQPARTTRQGPQPAPGIPLVGCLLAALFATPAQAGPDAERGPVIDVHVHTSPSQYRVLADVLASTGITRFVNLSGGTVGSGLEQALEAAEPYDGRIAVCANVSWRGYADPDFAAQQVALLEKGAALGARCLKIPKVLGLGLPDPRDETRLMAVDDPLLDPIWQAAGRLGLPVFMHTGDPKAFFEPLGPENERMDELGVHPEWSFADARFPSRAELLAARDRVLARHRGTTFIGVHFGNNPEDPDYVAKLLADNPNLYVDIAARLPEIGRHDPAKIRAIFERFSDRILFGTDLGFNRGGIMLGSVGKEQPRLIDVFWYYAVHFRWMESRDRGIQHPTPIQGRWTIDSVGLSPPTLARIYRLNALKLLWGEDGAGPADAEALESATGLAGFLD